MAPQSIAISDAISGHDTTYQALVLKCRRIGKQIQRLVHAKDGSNTILGRPVVLLCGLDHAHLVVAELSVLMAGAVIIPVDPMLPSKRLQCILADCQACLVLTTPEDKACLEKKLFHSTNKEGEPLKNEEDILVIGFQGLAQDFEDALATFSAEPGTKETEEARVEKVRSRLQPSGSYSPNPNPNPN